MPSERYITNSSEKNAIRNEVSSFSCLVGNWNTTWPKLIIRLLPHIIHKALGDVVFNIITFKSHCIKSSSLYIIFCLPTYYTHVYIDLTVCAHTKLKYYSKTSCHEFCIHFTKSDRVVLHLWIKSKTLIPCRIDFVSDYIENELDAYINWLFIPSNIAYGLGIVCFQFIIQKVL